MKIAIGFGRKAGNDLFVLSVLEVFFHDLFNKIKSLFFSHAAVFV
jgi:hypothetical protein